MPIISAKSGLPITENWRRLSNGNGRVRCAGDVIQTAIIDRNGRWVAQVKAPHRRPVRQFFETEADAIIWMNGVTASLNRQRGQKAPAFPG